MSVQANPDQLRFTSRQFSTGAIELRDKAYRLRANKENLVIGQGAWIGAGALSFTSRTAQYEKKIRTAADALDNAAHTLNRFANQMERVNELRNRAHHSEQESYHIDGDSMDDLHRRQSLLHQAHQLRQEAEWEAIAANSQADQAFHTIMSDIDSLADLNELSLTPAQLRAMRKEEALLYEMEAEQKSISVEDWLVLYYITKRDFNENVSPQDIIEQDLELDGITTLDDLKQHVATQIRINQSNDDLVRFCSDEANQEDIRCIVFKYNQAGGIDPASMTGLSAALTGVLVPSVKAGLSYIKNKLVPEKQSLPESIVDHIDSKKVETELPETREPVEVTEADVLGQLKVSDVVTRDAGEVNEWWKNEMGYDNPPYTHGTKAYEITLSEKSKFVRVYDGEVSGMYGGWMMKENDIIGLTPEQIRDTYALPSVPKFICDVEIPANTIVRIGQANPLEGWGKGGGIQIDLMGQRIGEFKNPRDLNAEGYKK